MFTNLPNSIKLVKASIAVLQGQPKLMSFPLITSAVLVILTLAFALPLTTPDLFFELFQNSYTGYLLLLLFYLLQYFVILFSNVAVAGAALTRLRGNDITLQKGLLIAARRLLPILGYALIASTVGLVIKWLSILLDKRKGVVADAILNLFDFKWGIATFLVVPVLAFEPGGPLEAIDRSVAHLKQGYGEEIEVNLALTPLFTLIDLAVCALELIVLITLVAVRAPGASALAVLIVGALVLIFNNLICGTLNTLFVTAIYQFTVDGEFGFFFGKGWIKKAFVSIQ
jgi:hypothetical protein